MAAERTQPETASLPFPFFGSNAACIDALRGRVLPRSEKPLQLVVYNQLDESHKDQWLLAFVVREGGKYLAGYGGRYDASYHPEHFPLWDEASQHSFEASRLRVGLVRTAITEAVTIRDQLHVPVDIVTENGLLIQEDRFDSFLNSNIRAWPLVTSQQAA